MVKNRTRTVVEAAHNGARARATARAETLFNQLIRITAHARRVNNTTARNEPCVDSLEVVFNDQQGMIDLIDYQPPESMRWVGTMDEKKFKYILYNIVYTYYELRQSVQFDLILHYSTTEHVTRGSAWPSHQGSMITRLRVPGISSSSYPMYISDSEPLHVDIIPAIREVFTLDDHDNGGRTIRVADHGLGSVVCTVHWNHHHNPIA